MAVLMMAVVSMGMAACSDDDDEKKEDAASLVGSWRWDDEEEEDYYQIMTFNSNGTGTFFEHDNDSGNETTGITYKYDSSKKTLTITFTDDGETYTEVVEVVEITKDKLVLKFTHVDDDGEIDVETLTFNKVR